MHDHTITTHKRHMTTTDETDLGSGSRQAEDNVQYKLNSASMGGIKVGDQFRVTAELFESDAWGTGASGDFSVMLKAKEGADDLPVFVDESDANGWQDGTKVEMVVKMVEVTINGETT